MRKKLVYGVGINDATYQVQPKIDGILVRCPIYQTWMNMLKRCYSAEFQERHPTYTGCSVAPEWLIFSNFRSWMINQEWRGMALDKDLLFIDNKVYSAETCVFVDSGTNTFTVDCGSARGEYPIGVYLNKQNQKLQAYCRNPFSKKIEYLGLFACPKQAHEVWRKRKHELALQLADLQADERVAEALRTRYATTTHLTPTL